MVHRPPAAGDDTGTVMEQFAAVQLEQGRKQLASGQVAQRTENRQQTWQWSYFDA